MTVQRLQINFIHLALLGMFLSLAQGCGSSCTIFNRLFNEPSCKDLKLDSSKKVNHLTAACGGAIHSKQVSVSCPASTGRAGQCTSVSNLFPVYVIIVPNNASGSFLDGNGVTYSTCRNLVQDFWNGNIQNVAGFYYSDNSDPTESLNCDDTSGCVLTQSTSCIAGWNPNTGATGTASFITNDQYLTCVYIDNSNSTNSAPVPSVGAWDLPMHQITIPAATHLDFTSGWVDAY